MGLALKKQEEQWTYGDYLGWPDEERWELIDGIAYNMSPAPSMEHQEVFRELSTEFSIYLRGKTCKVFLAPFDVILPENNEKEEDCQTVVQPDIFVICDRTKLDSRKCKGAPDLVIEILSPSTTRKDMTVKFALYERVGVKEYWIVHPLDKTVLVYKLEGNKYARAQMYSAEDKIKVGIFEDLEIDLGEVFMG
ncbi:Uma2 family endonuclease [Candidatus Desantisbacteria bacterium]|nr:Uma2 family endonuclease [Candidatus Desantisbacteria bacterium]